MPSGRGAFTVRGPDSLTFAASVSRISTRGVVGRRCVASRSTAPRVEAFGNMASRSETRNALSVPSPEWGYLPTRSSAPYPYVRAAIGVVRIAV